MKRVAHGRRVYPYASTHTSYANDLDQVQGGDGEVRVEADWQWV